MSFRACQIHGRGYLSVGNWAAREPMRTRSETVSVAHRPTQPIIQTARASPLARYPLPFYAAN